MLHRALLNINAIIYSDHEDLIVHLSDGEYPAKPHQKFETEIIKKAIDDAKEKAKKSISLFKEYTGYAGRIGSLGWEIIKKHPIVMFNKNSTIPKDLRRALQEYITAEEKAVVLIGRRGNELELDHK